MACIKTLFAASSDLYIDLFDGFHVKLGREIIYLRRLTREASSYLEVRILSFELLEC